MKISSPYFMLFFALFSLLSCQQEKPKTATTIIDQSIAAHGLNSLQGQLLEFTFRDHSYSLQLQQDTRVYSRVKIVESDTIKDVLDSNDGFIRTINGTEVKVADSMATKYANSVNSVLYFIQTPLVLKDPAVHAEYKGETSVDGAEYDVLKVTFSQDQGGKDFEDEFRYWINTQTKEVDYLAYSYFTDGGGIRFRKAYNKRRVQDVLFQDYENYKPQSLDISLDSLPVHYTKGTLSLLSVIENTDVIITPDQECC